MPFGLCNAPATFQWFINDIFRDLLDVCVVIYLDDILIYSDNIQDHQKHVRWVLARLRTHSLYVKLEKCVFSQSTISFLGYQITPQGIQMDQTKVETILSWPTPKSRKALQRFLGFSNYYRKFIKDFSSTVKPLTSLTSIKVPFRWTNDAQRSFDSLKDSFTSAPILQLPDASCHFTLEVDSSHFALGAILSQQPSLSEPLHPVAFYSRTLTPSEKNYPIGEKELLAIKGVVPPKTHF